MFRGCQEERGIGITHQSGLIFEKEEIKIEGRGK